MTSILFKVRDHIPSMDEVLTLISRTLGSQNCGIGQKLNYPACNTRARMFEEQ